MATSVDMHYKAINIVDAAVASRASTPSDNASDVKLSAVAVDGNVLSDMVVCHTNTSATENAVTTGNNHCNPKRYSGFVVKDDAGTQTASLQVGWRRPSVDSTTFQAYATAPATTATNPESNEIVTVGWLGTTMDSAIEEATTRGFKEEVLSAELTAGTAYSVGAVKYTIQNSGTSNPYSTDLHVYLDGVICQGGGTGSTTDGNTYTYYVVTGGQNIKFYDKISAGTRITIIVW